MLNTLDPSTYTNPILQDELLYLYHPTKCGNSSSFLTTPKHWCSASFTGNALTNPNSLFIAFKVRCNASLLRDVPTCVCNRSIQNNMTKFYVGCQPAITLLFSDLGPTINKIYNTKHIQRQNSEELILLSIKRILHIYIIYFTLSGSYGAKLNTNCV